MSTLEKRINELKELLSKDQVDFDTCRNLLTRIEGEVIDIIDENDFYQDQICGLENRIHYLEDDLYKKQKEINNWLSKTEKVTLNDEFKREIFIELDKKYYSHWQLEKLLKESNIL
jgi:chromosome segregation ATPase